MNDVEQRSILSIALMAAFADGDKDERERMQIKSVAQSIAAAGTIDLASIYRDVLFKRVSLEDAARELTSPEARQLAYEMAVCVCDSDGASNDAERAFLVRLRQVLDLRPDEVQVFDDTAHAIAAAPIQRSTTLESAPAATMSAPELERMILNYAVLNGALELLPQSLASMAIIPLQMKMVYRIGKAHGFELDRGHIKEFVATAGIGLTSQYLEQIGTRLVGGLMRKVGGGLLGSAARQATSSAFSFASTYALGHLASRYYAGGRTLDTASLKAAYESLLRDAKKVQPRYATDIAARARTLDLEQLVNVVRAG